MKIKPKLKQIKIGVGLVCCLIILGCRSTLFEMYTIQEDRSRTKSAQTNIEDSVEGNVAGAGASIFPKGRTYKYKGDVIEEGKIDQIISHSPYEIGLSLGAPLHPIRGLMTEIEIQECYFEIYYKNGEKNTIQTSINQKDWVRSIRKKTRFLNKSVSFYSGSKLSLINIDYPNLKEIRFYIKYVGIYENRERREYWQERYFIPVHTEEKRNWFDQLARQ